MKNCILPGYNVGIKSGFEGIILSKDIFIKLIFYKLIQAFFP